MPPFTRLLIVLASLPLAAGSPAAAGSRPNVVVILADDLGYADVGFNGAKDIQTPHLDRLAESGVKFTQGYCNHPFCAPSRAALLSGRYQHRFGFEKNPHYDPGNPHLGIDPSEKLLPVRLQEAGYATGGVGKWHLGAAAPFHPCNRGFDYFFGFLGGGHDYYRIDARRPVGNGYLLPLVRNDGAASFDGYLTTALSRDAAGFIEANRKRPFFLFVSYNAPHTPLQAPEELIAKYAHVENRERRVYSAMVDAMDQGVGVIVAALEEHGLRENTIIFFLSDNGGPQPMNRSVHYSNGSSNDPLRGGKTNLYEGGIRVPFLVSWPAGFPAGVEFHQPVISLDIARTAVEAAGGDASAEPALEGVDLAPFLRGEAAGAPHDALYWRDQDGARWAVLGGAGDKCVVDEVGSDPELYRPAGDVHEDDNLANQRPEAVAEFRDRWAAWNLANVPGRIMRAKEYEERQQAFYREILADQTPSQDAPTQPR